MMRDEVAMHTVRTEYSWCVLALNNILRELEEWLGCDARGATQGTPGF